MMRWLAIAVLGSVGAAAQTVETGFTSIFNGGDFTGWTIAGPAESFTIQDGAIVAKGQASHAYYTGSVI